MEVIYENTKENGLKNEQTSGSQRAMLIKKAISAKMR